MKKLRIVAIWLVCLSVLGGINACRTSYYKVPIVKSTKRYRPYDQKKDRGKKRVKVKKYKSLKGTSRINEK